MKKWLFFILSLLITGIVAGGQLSADSAAGLYKITVNEGWNFISLPLQTIQLARGKITSLTSNTITYDNAGWADNEYQYDVFLLTSGSGEGYFYRISSNSADTITVFGTLSPLIAAGDYFTVYQAYTLIDLFGDHNGPLHAGTSRETADEIYLWNAAAQGFSTALWLSEQGWVEGASLITDNSVTLIPNQACFVVRKLATSVTLNLVGTIPDSKQTIGIVSGDTAAGCSFPTAVTYGGSGLASVLTAGVSPAAADNIYLWDYTEQKFGLPVWRSNYTGYEYWYQGSAVADSFSISPGTGLLIRNRGNSVNWQREKPYTAP